MSYDVVDIRLLARLSEQTLEELKALRREVADIRSLSVQTYEYSRRVERRQAELRDDVELTLKMELGGAMTHLETKLDAKLDTQFAHIENLEASLSRVESKMDLLAEQLAPQP